MQPADTASEGQCTSCADLCNGQALVVNGLDGCLLECAVPNVRSHEQAGIGVDDATLNGSGDHRTHTRYAKSLINDELCSLRCLVKPATSSEASDAYRNHKACDLKYLGFIGRLQQCFSM